MSKPIISKDKISISESAIVIEGPKYLTKDDIIKRGPTKEEIEQKIDRMNKNFYKYREKIVVEFDKWQKEERNKVENEAFNIVKKAVEEYESKISEGYIKYNVKLAEAKKEHEKIINTASEEIDQIRDEASKKGANTGKAEGYDEGILWTKGVIKKLNIILSEIAKNQVRLVHESKEQISEIIVVISRRIINALTESQPRVVYDNIVSVLKLLKGRTELIIRINGEDMASVTKHKKEFLQVIEGIEKIKILEDNTVDKGGCIIDTEYGSIDSRIVTQVKKIEKMVRDILKSKIMQI